MTFYSTSKWPRASQVGFNLYVKLKLKPRGIVKKYTKMIRVYTRRCGTVENILEVLADPFPREL